MKYLISIDGGGTKTKFCVSDLDGNILKEHTTGSTNYKSVGIQKTYENINNGFEKILEDLHIDYNDIEYTVFGISGCDSPNDYRIIMKEILKVGLNKEKIYLVNDAVLAFYAQTDAPGLVIVAGTGSIVLGIREDGDIYRVGGWGYNFSDLGSGYDIGRKVLKKVLLYCDECIEYSDLFDCVLDFFNADSFKKLTYMITEINNNVEIANLASLVIDCAERGDKLAVEILRESSIELSKLAQVILSKISNSMKNNKSEIDIVLSGGTLNRTIYAQMLINNLREENTDKKLKFILQENQPVYGGIRLAIALANRRVKHG
ncbi:N-acetylglucosamine kinase [Clostridioides sp. ZZV15-6388]|uniref:N-acetylglucosamine kinase n=1 Tax=Clostridioides sp. ZZV15-6388 TaxID=2811499 RepID=UPI001D100172|nr:N-acetylglucosamine kinase [Clostridioides sp. ZZV15-6388]